MDIELIKFQGIKNGWFNQPFFFPEKQLIT